MRRTKDALQHESEDQRLRDEILIFWGRQQSELEHYASAKALDPMAFAARLGELWLSYSGQRDAQRMPVLRNAARRGRPPMAKAESGDGAHGRGTSTRKNAKSSGKAAPHKVSGIQKYWAQFTPEQRAKIMRKRQAKWSAAAKKKWGSPKKKATGRNVFGQPLPPPRESEAA